MKIFKLITLLIITITIFSCENLDINENPNKIQETHPSLLLTNIAVDASEGQGNNAMYASRMIVGTDEENDYQYFKWNRKSFEDYSKLRQVTKMMEEAKRIKNNSYLAIGHFFRAYYFYNLTLVFGDIPYQDALKGEKEKIYLPKYTAQEDVFKGILNELDKADKLLNSDDLVSGDPIFKGNVSKWKKLINSYRLKVLITLSKKVGSSSIDIKSQFASIYNAGNIISSFEDGARLNFFDAVDSRYTEFNSSSYGSGLYMASTFVDLLKERKDPRLFAIAELTKNAKQSGLSVDDFNGYEGGNPIKPYNEVNLLAAAGKVSKVDARYSHDPTAEAHNLLSYSELQFILAEASLRGWISGGVEEFYNNAIKANFKFYSIYAKGYQKYYSASAASDYLLNSKVDFSKATSFDNKLELIMTQKYITSFLQNGWRMYFDYLRTGYPTLPYSSSNPPSKRWIYPLDEYNNNTVNVKKAISRQFQGNDGVKQLAWWLK